MTDGERMRDVGAGIRVDERELDLLRGFTLLEPPRPATGAEGGRAARGRDEASTLRRQRDDLILMLIRLGVTEKAIAREIGLSQSAVNLARHRALRRHLP